MSYLGGWIMTILSAVLLMFLIPSDTPLWLIFILGIVIRGFWTAVSDEPGDF